MHESLKMTITINVQSEEEQIKIGKMIHEQLKNNQDYIDDNIVLNIDAEHEIWIGIFKECKNIPKITI